MSEFAVVSTPEELLAAFLREIGFDAGVVERGGAVSVKLAGQGRFALVMASGVDRNVWHVVAVDFTQICVGGYALWSTLVGLGAHYGYGRDEEQSGVQSIIWHNRWQKANRLVNEYIAEKTDPGTLTKPTKAIFNWLVAEEQ